MTDFELESIEQAAEKKYLELVTKPYKSRGNKSKVKGLYTVTKKKKKNDIQQRAFRPFLPFTMV